MAGQREHGGAHQPQPRAEQQSRYQHSRDDHGHQALTGPLCLQRGEFKVVVGEAYVGHAITTWPLSGKGAR